MDARLDSMDEGATYSEDHNGCRIDNHICIQTNRDDQSLQNTKDWQAQHHTVVERLNCIASNWIELK